MSETLKKVVEKAGEAVQATIGGHTKGAETMTLATGCPVAHSAAIHSLTAGPNGPVLMQDTVLLEKIKQFTREKIPARNVHALGTGVYGTLTVTNDITKYTKAKLFSGVGKKTEFFARFSGIFTEQGDPDTFRDPRGFALKFYTEEGNWDLLAINTPVFAVRDAKVGPDAVHAFKRDPRTSNWNPTQTWDYVANHPEGLHQQLMIYTDRGGTPMSFRRMHAYGCNTFSFINANNERFWVKFHLICDAGAKGLTQAQAKLIAGEDPNFLFRDLHDAIERGDRPTWRFCCQVMPEAEGYQNPWAFDCSKVWYHQQYPLIDIGTIELNRNPVDYFAEVEQVAFSPATVVPGIGFSPDKLLQGRLLIYDDAQHHRIGPNFKELAVNCPRHAAARTNYTGGNMQLEIRNRFPHYFPSSFGGAQPLQPPLEPPLRTDGKADYYEYSYEGSDFDYYEQPGKLFQVLNERDQQSLIENVATSLEKIPDELALRICQMLTKVNARLGRSVQELRDAKKKSAVPKMEGEKAVEEVRKFLQQSVTISP